jgi:hypothetical protein
VAGSCECGDEPSCSSATVLVLRGWSLTLSEHNMDGLENKMLTIITVPKRE